jgi:curved DNA-binding protein CbpA
MIASHHTGDITFYEELGLAPGAYPEEIRDAYRSLVRLLHPDQQTDPQLKAIAEKQMRKLNRSYAVLSDPARRLRYNEILNHEQGPPILVDSRSAPDMRRIAGRMSWIAAIVFSAGLLVWLAWESTPGPQTLARDPGGLMPAQPYSPAPISRSSIIASQDLQISQLRSDLRAVSGERDAAIRELTRLQESSPAPESGGAVLPEATDPAAPAVTPADVPVTPRSVVFTDLPAPRVEPLGNQRLAGFWFYAKPPQGQLNKNRALYRPEYIEATIWEENSVIHGKYRSRFQIADRGISPDVNFSFAGTPIGSQITCPWTGPGGARGDLTLKLVSDNSMRIDWTASDLGSHQGLNSGTAILTRRIE